MFNIDDEDLEEETLEEKVFDKADYIGEVLTGERKVNFKIPSRTPKTKTTTIKRPSKIDKFMSGFKSSFKKYKNMSLKRLIGMSVLIILSVSTFALVIYLLLFLLSGLLKFGLFGFIIFLVAMCAIIVCGVVVIISHYNHK